MGSARTQALVPAPHSWLGISGYPSSSRTGKVLTFFFCILMVAERKERKIQLKILAFEVGVKVGRRMESQDSSLGLAKGGGWILPFCFR